MSAVERSGVPEGYRPDINGLRAWAVVAVVLYHFGVPGVSGGFAGVDVFFAISGFLMTGIIVGGLERGNFGTWKFYLARARRILPALTALCAALLVLGWFLLMPAEYRMLGRHARESLFFSSNLRYLDEAGYFDAASHEKWLLHTWSLSVEWQFYLLLPLLLLAVWKLFPSRTAVRNAMLLVAGASLAACVALTYSLPEMAFYTIQSRAWEMLAGGLVYLCGSQLSLSQRPRQLLSLAGIATIILSCALFDSRTPWPGAYALLPVAGACLVILARHGGSVWTCSAIPQWLGTRSYSIYLWHWPLVVGLVYLEKLEQPLWIAGGLALTLLLSQLSYALVEEPARRRTAAMSPKRAAVWVLASALLVISAAQWVRRSGIPERLPPAIGAIEAERHNRNPQQDECLGEGVPCTIGGPQIRALVVGDSHADATVTAVAASLGNSSQGIYFRGTSSCLTVFGAKKATVRDEGDCAKIKNELASGLDTLHPGLPLIIINRTTVYALGDSVQIDGLPAGAPQVYFSKQQETPTPEFLQEFRRHFVDTACALSRHHPLYLTRPIPEMPASVPTAMGKAMLLGKQREIALSLEDYHRRHAFVWGIQDEARERCGAVILDPLPYLCDRERCYGSREGRPIYADDDHLSEYGNRLLVPMFAPIFNGRGEQPDRPAPTP